jgi:hypothetical protein
MIAVYAKLVLLFLLGFSSGFPNQPSRVQPFQLMSEAERSHYMLRRIEFILIPITERHQVP